MRALIIAPHHPDLPNVAAEVAAVSNAHPGHLLQGQVDERDIAQAVAPGGYDLFWCCTHSTRDGILLNNGILPASRLITYITASGASIVMLNTCESIHLAAQIVDATTASVIATISDLPDTLAATTGALFARQLAQLGDPRAAYQRSKPGQNRTYVYLQNPATTPPKIETITPPPRKRGAQPRNKNALKHGYYATTFDPGEIADLTTLMSDGIDDEIYAMRVHFRRVLALAREQSLSLDEATRLLDAAGRASTTLATLLRTKRLISPNSANDTATAISDAIAAIARELNL